MVRVLHVLNRLNNSGIESFIMNVYRNIDRNKVQFDFLLTGEKSYYDDEVQILGGKIYRYVNNGNRYKLISIYRNALKELSNSYNIIHIHTMSSSIFFVARYAKKFGFKNVIVHCHGCGHKGIIHKFFQLLLNKYTTIKVACSDVAGNALFGKKNNSNIIYFNNAIDTSNFSFNLEKRILYRNKLNLKEELACVNVGRFSYEKNHMYLLEIFHEIVEKRKISKLYLIGWGEEEKKIKEKITQLRLENNVIILGQRADVNNLLNAMDVFILPSLFEGMPVVAIEAQTNGLPVFLNDKITQSVNLTGLAYYLPINIDPKIWADNILNNELTRKDMSLIVKEKGFDINKQSNYIQNFYLSL